MEIKNPLLKVIYKNDKDLFSKVQAMLASGADPNEETEYFETPLRVASNNGRFDVVKILFEHGANPEHLKWTEIFHAIAYGSLEDVKAALNKDCDLHVRDTWNRTPFLLAIQTGEIQKIELLLSAGANRNDKGRCDKLPLEYAIQSDDDKTLSWLIAQGFSFETYNYFGRTPLMLAAEYGSLKCIHVLLNAGADVTKKDRGQFERMTAIAYSKNADIAKILEAAGDDLNDVGKNDMESRVREELLGLGKKDKPEINEELYQKQKYRTFGASNPEICKNQFWYEMVRSGVQAYHARTLFNDDDYTQPVWCYKRYGKSINNIGNGEYIEIAGEHEDHYDPDFCIYNDVFHHKGYGFFDIYMYPKEVFPPTDSHTATLIGEYIYIIGNLGYYGERKYGTTPVYRLNVKTFTMEFIQTSGENPGWIYKHKAYLNSDKKICIYGGEVLDFYDEKERHSLNKNDYELCLNTFTWTKHSHIPLSKEPEFFPEEYKQFRYLEGTLLGFENKGKWRLVKILKVHRIDVSKGQTILIANNEITSPVDDFLFVVFTAYSNEYECYEELQKAVADKTWSIKIGGIPRRTTSMKDNYRHLKFENVTEEELSAFKVWKAAFDNGDAGIF